MTNINCKNPKIIRHTRFFFMLSLSIMTYPILGFTSNGPYVQERKLYPSGIGMSGTESGFAGSLSLDGNRLLIGSQNTADTGIASIYDYDGETWVRSSRIIPVGGRPNGNFGYDVKLFGDFALIGSPERYTYGLDSGLALLYQYNGSRWILKQSLVASEPREGGRFGCSVDQSNDTLIVAACSQNNVFVFKHDGNQWLETQKLIPQTLPYSDSYGLNLAIHGDWLMISAIDVTFFERVIEVYQFNGIEWEYSQTIETNGSTSVAIDNQWAIIKTNMPGQEGVNFFKLNGSVWEYHQSADTGGFDVSFSFGDHFVLSEDKAYISDSLNTVNSIRPGAVFAYELVNDSWVFKEKLVASDGAELDLFGGSLAVSDNHLIVGANGDDSDGLDAGAAYVFEASQGLMEEQTKLKDGRGAVNALFGAELSVFGDYMLVGASGEDRGLNQFVGAAYMHKKGDQGWLRTQKLTAGDPSESDRYGFDVTVGEDWAFISAPGDNLSNIIDAGSVYTYERSGEVWNPKGKIITLDRDNNDNFGYKVLSFGGMLFASSIGDDENGQDSGSVYVYEHEGSRWILSHKITPPYFSNNQEFGRSLAATEQWLFIGAASVGVQDSLSGTIYVYAMDQLNGAHSFEIKSGSSDVGWFGFEIAASGNQLFTNSHLQNYTVGYNGVEWFEYDGFDWVHKQRIVHKNHLFPTGFGLSLSSDDNNLMIGTSFDPQAQFDSGVALLYERTDDEWIETFTLMPRFGAVNGAYAKDVYISNRTMIVGSSGDDTKGTNSGTVFVFENDLIVKHGFDR